MGQAKKRLMEYEHSLSVIDGLISIFSSNTMERIVDSEIVLQLIDLRDRIHSLDNNSMDSIELISDILNDDIRYVYSELLSIQELIESKIEPLSNSTISKLKNLTKHFKVRYVKLMSNLTITFTKQKIFIILKDIMTNK